GGDLESFAELSAQTTVRELRSRIYGDVQALVRSLWSCPVPTFAAVDGPAIGLGFDLALACDGRFFGPAGYVQQGWARAGLIPGIGGIALLSRCGSDLLWRLVADQPRLNGP